MSKFIDEHKTEITLFLILIAILIGTFMYKSTKSEPYKDPNLGVGEEKEEFSVKYAENEYKVITMDVEDLLRLYNADFMYYLTTNVDKSWNLLTENAKKSFTNQDNYVKYIEEISTNNTRKSSVVSYNITKNGSIVTYDIVTSENIKYTIVENGIWNYKVSFIKKL